MANYKYVLVCFSHDDGVAVFKEFHRKYDAQCRFRCLSNYINFDYAYIVKVVPNIHENFEVDKIIKLI